MTIALGDLTGLWRRDLLTAPGVEDRTTRVFWAQGTTLHADLRVPDPFVATSCEGFAGLTTVADGVCEWHRRINLAGPLTGRDVGTLGWHVPGEVLIETGIEADYTEVWARVSADVPDSALYLSGDACAVLIWSGTFFLLGLGDPGALKRPGADAGSYTLGSWDGDIGIADLSTDLHLRGRIMLRRIAPGALEIWQAGHWTTWTETADWPAQSPAASHRAR